jgi:hypothetical protein
MKMGSVYACVEGNGIATLSVSMIYGAGDDLGYDPVRHLVRDIYRADGLAMEIWLLSVCDVVVASEKVLESAYDAVESVKET